MTTFQNRRLDPDVEYIKEILDSQILGHIPKVIRSFMFFEKRNDWQIWKRHGRDLLNNWGIHLLDQLFYLFGREASLHFSKLSRLSNDGDAEDHVEAVIGLGSEVTADFFMTSSAMLSLPSWMILGTKGTVEISENTACSKYILDGSITLQTVKLEIGSLGVWSKFYDNYYAHIHERAPLLVRPEEIQTAIGMISEIKNQTPEFM